MVANIHPNITLSPTKCYKSLASVCPFFSWRKYERKLIKIIGLGKHILCSPLLRLSFSCLVPLEHLATLLLELDYGRQSSKITPRFSPNRYPWIILPLEWVEPVNMVKYYFPWLGYWSMDLVNRKGNCLVWVWPNRGSSLRKDGHREWLLLLQALQEEIVMLWGGRHGPGPGTASRN